VTPATRQNRGVEHPQCYVNAKIQGCANVSSNNIDQKVWGLEGEHPRLTLWNLLNYTVIENAHKVRKKIFVFYFATIICTITKGKEQRRAYLSRYDQSAWTAN